MWSSALPAQENSLERRSPYGVCALLIMEDENEAVRLELRHMEKAGMRWALVDFSWSCLRLSDGEWSFDYLDRVVNLTKKYDVDFLSIQDGRARVNSAHEHPETWNKYVRRSF